MKSVPPPLAWTHRPRDLLLNMAFQNRERQRERESGFICAANEAVGFSLNVCNEFSDKNSRI